MEPTVVVPQDEDVVKSEAVVEKKGVSDEAMAVVRKVVEAGKSESVRYQLVKDGEGKYTGERKFLNTPEEVLESYERLVDPGQFTRLADLLLKAGFLGPSSIDAARVRGGETNEGDIFPTVFQVEIGIRPIRDAFISANKKDDMDYKGGIVAGNFLKDWAKGLKGGKG